VSEIKNCDSKPPLHERPFSTAVSGDIPECLAAASPAMEQSEFGEATAAILELVRV
tara:strand:+ start:16972 stop:17139 length:168 start_codon:yes stop_codon:yes gene_type:complete